MIRLRYKIFLISLDVIEEYDKIDKILLITTHNLSSFAGFLVSETSLKSNQIKVMKLMPTPP